MSTAKQNIFNALTQAHSDEEGENQTQTKKFPPGPQPNPKKSERIRKGKNTHNEPAAESNKLKDAKQILLKRKESDLDHPHQLERHSGTGVAAYDKREKKSGGGAHNWGTKNVKEDFEKPEKENQELTTAEEEQENKEDNTLTFEEYFQKNGHHEIHQQVNEAKVKVTEEQLLKEIGKVTPLQPRKDREVDDYAEGHSKKNHENHNVSMNTDHANLLGFRTGFKVFDRPSKPRKEKSENNDTKKENGPETTPISETQKSATENQENMPIQRANQKNEAPRKIQDTRESKPMNLEDEKSFPKLG